MTAGQLTRAAVELAKNWRTDKYLRRLDVRPASCIHASMMPEAQHTLTSCSAWSCVQAVMIVADDKQSLQITGNGDVLEPEHGAIAIGSGGNYAFAAARALMDSDKSAEDVARRALDIAADICVYTNHNVLVETLDADA